MRGCHRYILCGSVLVHGRGSVVPSCIYVTMAAITEAAATQTREREDWNWVAVERNWVEIGPRIISKTSIIHYTTWSLWCACLVLQAVSKAKEEREALKDQVYTEENQSWTAIIPWYYLDSCPRWTGVIMYQWNTSAITHLELLIHKPYPKTFHNIIHTEIYKMCEWLMY